jgi:sterol desaturase/sphingolipid hydroxylase (fatty acid hydroxylase superfamily)
MDTQSELVAFYDSLDIWKANVAYLSFWLPHWIFGIILSLLSHKGYFGGTRKITDLYLVVKNVMINMIFLWIATNVVFILPFRMFINVHIALKYLICLLFTETWFYHVHLLLHHPQLYGKFHKLHHTYVKPYSLTALYSTPYEAILCNMLSVSICPILVALPPVHMYIWFAIVAFNATFTHSGYKLEIFGVTLINGAHDTHHRVFTKNYGTLQIFDRLYGTYQES